MLTTDHEIDARGLLCPLPVLRARKVLEGMAPGSLLLVLADDPMAVIDMPHFCAESGHGFLGMTEGSDWQVYLLRRRHE